ncbi:helix-turn-helix domain-containing protein [Alkalihalobacterium elongatum]|uniref:helix-turn-helix domain-containing protein n=1 Tax=Alkalihalobacterium elongatum TaxID=2675466 RepID=UPI001C1FF211|nr:helix-turn-helix transcriptional regulator [Alkalihalobacterium elongatum]
MGFTTFNNYLKERRIKKGLSIRKLSEMTNVSAMYISELERGKRNRPSPEILSRLAKGLDETQEDFLVAAGYIDPDEYVKMKKERDDIEWSLAEQEEEKKQEQKKQEQKKKLNFLLDSDDPLFYQDRLLTKEEKAKIDSMIKIILKD